MNEQDVAVMNNDLTKLELLVEKAGNLPPEDPSLSPPEWIRKNLFSTPFNGLLTIVFGLFSIWAFRGLLSFMFSPDRTWRAPATNARLLMAGVYPESQFNRVWFLLGLTLVLAGLSMGILKAGSPVSIKRLSIWIMTTGVFLVGAVFLTPTDWNQVDADGNALVADSFFSVIGSRTWPLIISFATLALGLALWFGFGEIRRRSTFVPYVSLVFATLFAIAAALWVVPIGHYGLLPDGTFINEPDRTIALSTKLPITIVIGAMFLAYLIGRVLGPILGARNAIKMAPPSSSGATLADLDDDDQTDQDVGLMPKFLIGLSWVLLPFIGIFVILRDPGFELKYVLSVDIPLFLAFAIGGGLVLWFLSRPKLGEIGRLVAAGLMGLAMFHWVAAFFGWYPMLQKVRLSFLLLAFVALAAHNFAGDNKTRMRFVMSWVGMVGLVHYFATVINSTRTLELRDDIMLMGLLLTVFVAAVTILVAFPLGIVLALARTSSLPIFRQLATLYIEFVRGVPLVTILFFMANILPLFLPGGMNVGKIAAATAGYAFFSAAYLAENVRGGLQSIRRGQFEAADALGLTTSMRTSFIIIPQALRASIPQLVGQTIGTFKETSLLLIIGSLDLLLIARSAIPNQTEFVGVKMEGLLVVSVIYFIGSFGMSKYSQKLERRLGVGER